MIDLGQWLLSNKERKREPGAWDCCCFPADWALANGLPDPMAKWRRTYDTETEALDLIAAAGSLVSLFAEGMTAAGVARRTGSPQPGDIGVLAVGDEEAGAIFIGPRWALVAERGLAFASVDPEHVKAVWCVHG